VSLARESKFQNAREFLGVLLGIFICHQLRPNPFHIHWVGDNRAALSWAKDDMARSRAAQASFLALTWCKLKGKIDFADITHIAGNTMGDVDSLSRFEPLVSLDPVFDWSKKLPLELLNNFFMSCDPTAHLQANLVPWDVSITNSIQLVEQCLAPWKI
jgi:hypothetical protein